MENPFHIAPWPCDTDQVIRRTTIGVLTAVISFFALPSPPAYSKVETEVCTIVCMAEARTQQPVKLQTEIACFPRLADANFSALPSLAAASAGTTRHHWAPPLLPPSNGSNQNDGHSTGNGVA